MKTDIRKIIEAAKESLEAASSLPASSTAWP
jgi:hypothetical protein